MSTPWARQKISQRLKAWWANMSPEERQARLVLRREVWRRKHPERAAAFDRAMQEPAPCGVCGAEAWPYFGQNSRATLVLGWRCKEHWPPRAKKKPSPGEPGEGVESAGEVLD